MAGIVGAAGGRLFIPATPVNDKPVSATVTIAMGEVGSSINLNVVAQWRSTPLGTNLATGVVTSVDIEPGHEVRSGDELYSVDLRPVSVAEGEVPAFRDLSAGSHGPDVRQLQKMLRHLGLYKDSIDGIFADSTGSAVANWQFSRGQARESKVLASDIVYLPGLPTRILLDTSVITVGARLAGNDRAISVVDSAPQFTVPVTPSQATAVQVGASVDVTGPAGQKWTSRVKAVSVGDDGATTFTLGEATGGNALCAGSCDTIPVTGQTLLSAVVTIVPLTAGLVVPTAALKSLPNGDVVVIEQDGQRHKVTVAASARGLSVVTGAELGLVIRVPSDPG